MSDVSATGDLEVSAKLIAIAYELRASGQCRALWIVHLYAQIAARLLCLRTDSRGEKDDQRHHATTSFPGTPHVNGCGDTLLSIISWCF
jgi:hypothetical protein